jgi:SAM-dependent methyltransferase
MYNGRMKTTGQETLEVMNFATWYNDWIFSFIKPYCKGNILEVGAGIGNFTGFLSRIGKVTAIDYETKYLSLLKNKFGNQVSTGFGDIEKGRYFFKNKRFETIICLNVLEHVKKDANAVSNMYSLLNRNGKLILLVPAHKVLFSKFDTAIGHFKRYTLKDIKILATEHSFELVENRYFNWVSFFGWLIFVKLSGKDSMPAGNVKIFDFIGKYLLWPEKYVKLPFGLSVLAILEKK